MAKGVKLMVVFLTVTSLCKAQTDTLNKLNAKGKKQGYWQVYFDDSLRVSDSSKAVYYGLDFYDNGKRKIQALMLGSKATNIKVPEYMVNYISKPKPLYGVFEFEFESRIPKEKVRIVEEYNNGILLHAKCYLLLSKGIRYQKEECLSEHYDFTKKYNNQQGSYYAEFKYCKYGTSNSFWYRKDKDRWKFVKIK